MDDPFKPYQYSPLGAVKPYNYIDYKPGPNAYGGCDCSYCKQLQQESQSMSYVSSGKRREIEYEAYRMVRERRSSPLDRGQIDTNMAVHMLYDFAMRQLAKCE